MLLASEGYGIPYAAEQLFVKRDMGSAGTNFAPNEEVNETSVLRNKRDTSLLKNHCIRPTQLLQSPGFCEKGAYTCHGYSEIVCSKTNFACLKSVPKVGSPNCVPQREWVTIDLGTKGKRKVRRTYKCRCA